jgi:23S rRNA (pseudouridine1915-N3)-methyltransferase
MWDVSGLVKVFMSMLSVAVVCVGKTKEPYIRAGISDYLKRTSPYMDIAIEEIPDERLPPGESGSVITGLQRREGLRLLEKTRKESLKVVLDPKGDMWSSEDLSRYLKECSVLGKHRVSFLIGGVYGHSPEVLGQADRVVSFSRMTFNHQIIRLMLLEQLFRAAKINRNEPYHR